ncbi:MAG TPA: hypothetical protein VN671_09420, partial [Solirubrobacterales bacterium]|nr:hypothetical protein [Solirubrobacterales bacterium]
MIRRLTVAALCVAALALLIPIGASAARPLRFSISEFEPAKSVHETLEGPCGAAVNSEGDLFVSDYYRSKIVVFDPSGEFLTQIAGVSPVDAPCGLAIDAAGVIYANLYHGGIAVLEPSGSTYTNRGVELTTHATGVAIDPVTGNLLVDERTAIGEYELPLTAGEAPLRTIGSLGDGYGLAVSDFAGTEGWVYAADAADATVKAFDPATSLTAPVEEIDGSGTPLGRFNDLTDAALSLDNTDGHLLVADNLDGQLFEQPRAAVEEFDPAGAFLENLEPQVIDGEPIGLTVDDSGNVYVTSGNSEKATVFVYGPFPPPPPARFAASA